MFSNIKYVYRILIFLSILLLLGVVFNSKILLLSSIILLCGLFYFFRSNLELKTYDKNIIISPSSSKVISIEKTKDYNEIFTYLSPLDKHFMIAPTDCKVVNIEDAKTEKDSERKRITCIDNSNNQFMMDLIVAKPFQGIGVFGGWLPKIFYNDRIVVTCKEGELLKRGEQFGLIRFGSNMKYYFPLSYEIKLKEENHYELGDKIALQK